MKIFNVVNPNSNLFSLMRIVSFLTVVILGTTGCLSDQLRNISDLKKCEIDFNTIQIKNIASQGLLSLTPKLSMDTEMEVKNPNKTQVTVYAFDFDVSLVDDEDDTKELLGKILSEEEFIIPPESSILIPVKIRSEFEEQLTSKLIRIGLKLIRDLNEGKETTFEMNGWVKYRTFLGSISIPVRETQKAKLR
ncbi:MAG: LEA type 2 family protein [Leptospira sp.]|nr:LEA type 2 family protein [Leptospira sp.]